MTNIVRIGIIGCGKAGTNFALALLNCGSAEVRRVAARTEASAHKLAERLPTCAWTTDYHEVLTDGDIDGVIVATPDKLHCEMVMAAAQAGKHVLCEKPMCNSVDEADRMIAACRDAGVILMVGFTERYATPYQDAKRRIESGEIGEPKMILARRCHPKSIVRSRDWLNDSETGGVLNYAGTHNIDLICWLMNAPVRRVYAEMGQLVLEGRDFTDSAVMTFLFENGAIATLYESFAYPSPYPHGVDRSIEVLGTRGVIRVDMMRQPVESIGEAGVMIGDSVTWPPAGQGLGGAIRAEAEHFVQCILTGAEPLSTGEDGRRAIALAQAAKQAARTGAAVEVTR